MKAKTEMKMKKLEKMYDVEFRCEKRFRPETKTYDWRGEVIENTLIRDNQISDCDFTNAVFRNCTIEFVDFRDCITDNMVFDSCSFENIAFISDNEIYMPDGVKGLPEVPFVPGLEERIYQAIQTAEGKGDKPALDMDGWHTTYFDSEQNACGTAHCLAGWAVHLGGEEGYNLEKMFGSEKAGKLIYLKSCGFVPDFFTTNAVALRDLRQRLGITVPKEEK